jgi:cell division control protein 6
MVIPHKTRAQEDCIFVYSYSSVFKDESKLDINFVPSRLPHRESQMKLLNQFFRFAVETPGKMTQRVLVTGKVGVGKTALTKLFGRTILGEAQKRGISLHYAHINCRECNGSLFLILQRVISRFHPHYPRRGYSAQELLQALIQELDDEKAYLILTLDELDALIQNEGSDSIYSLTRVQEERQAMPQRLSLIGIVKDMNLLSKLDASTRSTLQRNIIQFEEYTQSQLRSILDDRVATAFDENSVLSQSVDLIAELAASEGGDARYAIELLWRAGKYADSEGTREVLPEHIRNAFSSVYPTIRKDTLSTLSLHHQLLLLGIARRFKQSEAAYLSMGEAENAYAVVCEEYGKEKRGHTQLWKYIQELAAIGLIKAESSSKGQRGKTTLISLPKISAVELEKELSKTLEA